MCVPAWAAFMLVGTLLWAYYQFSGEALPAHLHDAAGKVMPDKVFPFFLATKIPGRLRGPVHGRAAFRRHVHHVFGS